MKLIVTGHGHFATGIESTVKLLAGEIPGVLYIDFSEEMSEADLAKRFPDTDNLVFFCDLAGGTPYKEAVFLSAKHQNVAVLAGGNVGALLEVGLQHDVPAFEDAHHLAQLLIEASHAGIQEFQIQKYKYDEENQQEEGI